ncbi:hypothetical protein PF008_g29923 [Phytophthora fragariae]|uniref:Uncharacterized protein n=1 Tax=Phytophthora fragariae TaxID=53985 RepID=A0A6G0Q749_9STRA|nr:hypothetical protein PF008_g29923 [Phytophthora fragariae]
MSVEDYEAVAARVEQQWDFLVPWCQILQPRVHHHYDSSTELYEWEVSEIELRVVMPRRRGIHDEHEKDEATFCRQFRAVREAMALLIAVHHVDYLAYSHLMMEYCGVSVGDYGDELDDAPIASEFVVDLDVGAKEVDGAVTDDLARQCGTDHRLHPSEEYLETLKKIAALDDKLKPGESGVEVDVAVKLRCTRWSSVRDCSIASILLDVAKSEKEIAAQWKEFNEKSEEQDVPEGELRCKFVLKPMHADLRPVYLNLEVMQAFEHLFANSVCFSQIVMAMAYERGDAEDELVSKPAYAGLPKMTLQ